MLILVLDLLDIIAVISFHFMKAFNVMWANRFDFETDSEGFFQKRFDHSFDRDLFIGAF